MVVVEIPGQGKGIEADFVVIGQDRIIKAEYRGQLARLIRWCGSCNQYLVRLVSLPVELVVTRSQFSIFNP